MKTGYEVKAKDRASYLRERLADDLGYSGFDPKWLQKAWINGFQDHTYLFVVADDAGLREALERATGSDPIQLRFFSSGNYLGHPLPRSGGTQRGLMPLNLATLRRIRISGDLRGSMAASTSFTATNKKEAQQAVSGNRR